MLQIMFKLTSNCALNLHSDMCPNIFNHFPMVKVHEIQPYLLFAVETYA